MERSFITFSFPPSTADRPHSNSSIKPPVFAPTLYTCSVSSPLSASASAFSLLPSPTNPQTSSNSSVRPSSFASVLTPSSRQLSESTSSACRPLPLASSLYIKTITAPPSPIQDTSETDKYSTNSA
ncbi:hypothetical protein L873DRAFT_307600 [Choiromyces venosus 120613-1]|uniref:Uncharacterized protein n=1 Tax=Choiromyces venosus 120613-1 TaxID=1336337 RepID=A0A3N4IZ53_9PEZI|nr:hypothetical protein L873DRAFT_307600 [Choiromyces venosus 120613-1]